ncbi:MAG: UvrD-helicase domain-containing protein [Clostridia bacterium]|nr:UvrD-helicase domain-containing protein [Clostridia bacterium]
MARNWTAEQRSAIETRGKTLLISAAAGSGKTAVLTERIVRMLTDPDTPASLERMLIVTFTRAAAAELRQRISAALSEALAANPQNRHLHRQLLALSSAKISTISSYCLELVRANFQRLGLPAQFRMADAGELGVLSRSIMDELINRHYTGDPAFGSFADHFTGARNDDTLADTFLKLYPKLTAYPEGIDYLGRYADNLRLNRLSLQVGWGKIAAERTRRVYTDVEQIYLRACADMADDSGMARAYLPAFSADLDHIRTVLSALETEQYSALRDAILAYSPTRLGILRGEAKSEESERWKKARESFKEERGKLAEHFFLPSPEAMETIIDETAAVIDRLHSLLGEFEAHFTAEKKRRGICDFSDIERYALSLLVDEKDADTDIAAALAEQFDVICIDEYQDVNAVQDRIFRAIARPGTRFMVGDIKQSIYRFRGAEPNIFADYRRTFPTLGEDDGGAASIFMSNNFRCDRPIIDCSNRIFAYLFGLCGQSIGYVPADDLVCGKPTAEDAAPVTVALCPPAEADADDNTIPPEYRWIAAEIGRLLRDGRLDDGTPIRPAHIAILTRSRTGNEQLLLALEDAGIPCTAGHSTGFFENPEVLMMLCLLNTIDNPNRDVYLAGTLRSPLFGFTLDELITVRQDSPDPDEPLCAALRRYTETHDWTKGRQFLDRLAEYRAMAEGTPVDRLLNQLYRDTAVLAYAGAADDEARTPEQKRANLHLLYDYARRFEASSYKGLYNFILYLNDMIAEKAKVEEPEIVPEDAVRIMSIHQSKGLEFPVCFVADLGRSLNLKDAGSNLLFDHGAGIALRLRDESGFARRTTPIREAVAAYITDGQLEEEMRVLYVALTRARERLYLTVQCKKGKTPDALLDEAVDRRFFGGRDSLMRCTGYREWILTALSGTPEDCYRIIIPDESEMAEPTALPTIAQPTDAPAADDALIDTLRARFGFVYPDAHLTDLPAKLAVSRLYPTLLDDEALPDELNKPTPLPELRQRPAFLDGFAEDTEKLGAERGTATHVFLQFCDFARCAADPTPRGIAAEAARLLEAKFITPRMAELLRADELAHFFASAFYAELAAAQWQLRERRFHLYLPAAAFTADPDYAARLGEEQILVQGVIDLCFETAAGELILCDYNTDRLPHDREKAAAILRERHGNQLGYYAEACRALFGRAPDRICLWSLALGEAFEMN